MFGIQKEGFADEKKVRLPATAWQRRLWLFCEEPDSSLGARIFAIVSVVCILVSVVNFCLETLPSFDRPVCINVTNPDYTAAMAAAAAAEAADWNGTRAAGIIAGTRSLIDISSQSNWHRIWLTYLSIHSARDGLSAISTMRQTSVLYAFIITISLNCSPIGLRLISCSLTLSIKFQQLFITKKDEGKRLINETLCTI